MAQTGAELQLDKAAESPNGIEPEMLGGHDGRDELPSTAASKTSRPSLVQALASIVSNGAKKKREILRNAYKAGDKDLSKTLHDSQELQKNLAQLPEHAEPASSDGGLVKPLVFGGLDGIITTFAVVAGATGANLSPSQTLIMGFANLFADAFSMGLGEYMSTKAELEFVQGERDREAWEMENYPEGEIKEMVDLYKKKGVSEEDACKLISIMSKYTDVFIDHMMVEELGLLPPEADEDPKKQGLVMFVAFLVFGAVPLLGFIFLMLAWGQNEGSEHTDDIFAVSCILTAITCMLLGAVKAKYVKQSMIRSAFQMLFIGVISGAAAYGIGEGLTEVFG